MLHQEAGMRGGAGRLAVMVALALTLVGTLPTGVGAASPPDVTSADPVLKGVHLQDATILDLQASMASGTMSSVELTNFYLRRIRALDPGLHSVIATNPHALRQAAESDLARRADGPRGPLEGIPILLKDNIDTARPALDLMATTAGSFALILSQPTRDAVLVQRLRAAGGVILGKTNLSEWAAFRGAGASSGWSAVGGLNGNPYVLDRNPCGSSSGSGAAAAAAFATVAIGSDTDGSILCPSGINGLVGVRPSTGLVSRTGIVPISQFQDTAGPMARNATDAAIVLSVIQGTDPADPHTGPAAPYVDRAYLDALEPDALRGKRIGIWRRGNNSQVNAVVASSIATLQSLGATVIDNVPIPLGQAQNLEGAALRHEFKHDINAYLTATPGEHPADLAGLIAFNNAHADIELRYFGQSIFIASEATSGDLSDPAYMQTRQTATTLARTAIDNALAVNQLDAIFSAANGPAQFNAPSGVGGTGGIVASAPAAIAGYPAVTVPAGFTSNGVFPIGMQFLGPRWSEPTVLSFAYAFEQATHARKAPQFLPTLP
jgi:amidase